MKRSIYWTELTLLRRYTTQKLDRIPVVITYNRLLPNITETNRKKQNILKINENFIEIFKYESITAFKQKDYPHKIIGMQWIENERVKKGLKPLKEGKYTSCSTENGNICCRQVKITTSFKSQQSNKTWKIFCNVNCKTEYGIYLTECTLCNLQYVTKNEKPFN